MPKQFEPKQNITLILTPNMSTISFNVRPRGEIVKGAKSLMINVRKRVNPENR